MHAVGTERWPFSTRSRILPLSLGVRRACPVVGQVTIDETGPSFAFSFTENGTVAAWLMPVASATPGEVGKYP